MGKDTIDRVGNWKPPKPSNMPEEPEPVNEEISVELIAFLIAGAMFTSGYFLGMNNVLGLKPDVALGLALLLSLIAILTILKEE